MQISTSLLEESEEPGVQPHTHQENHEEVRGDLIYQGLPQIRLIKVRKEFQSRQGIY
uniref:Uncharacterized protein n=1 Tax=Lepeophtheirus salmonis TaxID=72036 RepID=A0A0K2SZC9_LEPSM